MVLFERVGTGLSGVVKNALPCSMAAILFAGVMVGSGFGQHAAFPVGSAGASALNAPLPSDEPVVAEEIDDDDQPTRDRTPEDTARIESEEAAKASKSRNSSRQPYPDNADYDLPAAPLIDSIQIVGASELDAKKAQRVITSREGEPLNPSKQREDIERLYELGLFQPNIQIQAMEQGRGVQLQYVVEPNPKVSSIDISGAQKISAKKIQGDLPVKAGEVYTIQAQNKIRSTVARLYEERGFGDATVQIEERPGANNTVDLGITVDEGTRMKIKDLVINGNDSIGDLKLQLRANNKGSWGPLKHYYNETKFQEDLERVKAAYVAKGYLDADVRRGDFIYAPDQSWVTPVIDVTEGPRYRVGRIDARGYSVFTRDEVVEPFRPMQGDYYDMSKFSRVATKVKNMYGDEGFMLCQVEPDFHKDPNRGLVDVDIEVYEGSRIYVGDVKVISESFPDDPDASWLRRWYSKYSPPVRDEVVQREVRLKPGQVYRRFDEVRTRESLQGLNVFQEVTISDQLTADPNVRDCVVQVEQGNTGNLIFGVGFGDVEGAFVYANYIEHNLFGMARDFRISGLFGSRAQSFDISYLDRWFMGYDLSAQFDLYHRNYHRTGNFDQTNTGITAEFCRPLSECVKDAVRLRIESIGFDFDDDDEPADTDIDDYLAATVRYRITEDTRDDVFFPTSGYIRSGSIETGLADGFLLKLEGQYANYVQLNDSWVWANNNMIGLMPYNADNIGYADRFFMGGGQDLRGFKMAGAGPHDGQENHIPIGGATKLISQNELRHAFTENLVGVVFADIGMLSDRPFSLGTPRASIGTGMRLRLPVAQVAVDVGVPVIRKSEDQTQILHFTLTSAF